MLSLRARQTLRMTWATSYLHTSRHRSAELKASIRLIAKIRKITDNQTSFAKAKEALLATQNDLDAALAWLEKDNVASGAKKAAKVASRVASDGLVGIAVLSDGSSKGGNSVRAAMVEVNCETDFVARNDLFSKLVMDIAHTAAYLAESPSPPSQALSKTGLIVPFPVDHLSFAPIISAPSGSDSLPLDPSRTISSAIQETISKVGEKISLRRACSFVGPALSPSSGLALRPGSYIHLPSATQPQVGKIGALVALALKSRNLSQFVSGEGDKDVRAVGRALARQIVGLNAERIGNPGKGTVDIGDASSPVLYDQPFMMRPGGGTEASVRSALNDWAREKGLVSTDDANEGIEVLEFFKWSAGEGIEKPESEGGFTEEVRRLSS